MLKVKNGILALAMAMLSVSSMVMAGPAGLVTIDGISVTTLASGVAVSTKFQVTCDPSFGSGTNFYISLSVAEIVKSKGISSMIRANGDNGGAIDCNGDPQTIEIVTQSSSFYINNLPFKKGGLALLNGYISVNNPDYTIIDTAQISNKEIKVQ